MCLNKIKYSKNRAKQQDIYNHLVQCDNNFSPCLSSYVNIEEYSNKIVENAITFEAWNENELLGLVACYLNDINACQGFITNVSVFEEYTAKGIGKQLLVNCEEYARKLKFRTLLLEVDKTNTKAISLYKKNRFVTEKENDDKLKMSKELNNNFPTQYA